MCRISGGIFNSCSEDRYIYHSCRSRLPMREDREKKVEDDAIFPEISDAE